MGKTVSEQLPPRPKTSDGSNLWVYAMVSLLGLIVPLLLFVGSEGEISFNCLLILVIVLWCQFRLAYTGISGQRRLTVMSFYIFVYVFLGVQPLVSVATSIFPNRIYLSEDLINSTIFLVLLGIAAFEIGYMGGAGRPAVPRSYQEQFKTLSPKVLWYANAAAGMFAGLLMLYYGPGMFLGLREYGGEAFFWSRDVDYTELVMVIYGMRAVAGILLFLNLYLWRVQKRLDLPGYRIRSFRYPLIFLGVLNLIVSNPLSAPRLWSGSMLLTACFIAMRWRKVRSFSVWTTVVSLTLLLLFSGLDPRHFTRQLAQDEVITSESAVLFVKDALQSLNADANFDAFAMLAVTTQYTETHGYSLGKQVLLPAFFWVPRSIWKSKPVSTSMDIADSINLDNLNVSCPLWAEGYANFGVLGVFIFLLVFGRLSRAADNFLVRTTGSIGPALQMVVSSFFAANTIILLRGDLTTGTMYLQLMIFLSFVILYSIRCLRYPRLVVYNLMATLRGTT